MRQQIVGSYYMGPESVEIVLRDGTGGEFYCTPEAGHIARIKIGADYEEWKRVLEIFFHEALEMAFSRLGCRFYAAGNASIDSDGCIVVARHHNFSEAVARVADLAAACLPDLEKNWKQFRQEKTWKR